MIISYKKFKILNEISKHIFILIMLIATFFPIYIMITISGKTNTQFMSDQWSFMWPFHFENYVVAWSIVSKYIFNSIFVCISSILLTFIFSLNVAFFFARYKFAFSKFLWYFFLILMLMPSVVNIIPLFNIMKHLNLLNTFMALIIVNIVGGQIVQIYILRNFIEEISQDLFDAAEIDGANVFQQIYKIVLPMSGGVLSTLAILQFVGIWNNYIWPMLILRDDKMLTLAVGLVRLDAEYVKNWGELMASYTLASLPMIIIFMFSMRLFMKGLSSKSVRN